MRVRRRSFKSRSRVRRRVAGRRRRSASVRPLKIGYRF